MAKDYKARLSDFRRRFAEMKKRRSRPAQTAVDENPAPDSDAKYKAQQQRYNLSQLQHAVMVRRKKPKYDGEITNPDKDADAKHDARQGRMEAAREDIDVSRHMGREKQKRQSVSVSNPRKGDRQKVEGTEDRMAAFRRRFAGMKKRRRSGGSTY